MKRIRAYISETWDELLHKVSWPSWGELQESAIVVLAASFLIALVVYVMDFVSNVGLNKFLYRLFE